MIVGTGIDIIEVDRVRRSHDRFGDRFLKRVFLPREIAYCLTQREPAVFLAARFAAKEAASKAFGTGIGERLGWLDIEIGRKTSGEPFTILHARAQILLKERAASRVHVSLSHTTAHAAAVAILERD